MIEGLGLVRVAGVIGGVVGIIVVGVIGVTGVLEVFRVSRFLVSVVPTGVDTQTYRQVSSHIASTWGRRAYRTRP